MDLADGTGICEAVEDIDVVVHAASAPRGDSEAAADAGVSNVVYISIVGIDEIPYSYYEHKLAAERAVEASEVPSTTLRITMFHEFVGELLETVSTLPIWPLPTGIRLQPIDVGEAADAVVERATTEPAGRVPDIGGPEVRTVSDLARTYRDARGIRRPIVRLPIPGKTAAAFRAGRAIRPDRTVGTLTWNEWVASKFD